MPECATKKPRRLAATLILAVALTVALGRFSETVEAVELKASVYLVEKSPPPWYDDKETLAFARKNRTGRIAATEYSPGSMAAAKGQQSSWQAYAVIVFNVAPHKYVTCFDLVFFEERQGKRNRIGYSPALCSTYPDKKIHIQSIDMKPPLFEPNRDLSMVVVASGHELSQPVKFRLVGEREEPQPDIDRPRDAEKNAAEDLPSQR